MNIKSILNLPSPEIGPNIENATVVRDSVISAFANGVSGTNDEIPPVNSDSESTEHRRTRVASLLGYTSSTAQHAKLFLNTLIAPREFDLVDARQLGLPVIEEAERSNVLLTEEKTDRGTLSIFTFPSGSTSPFIEPFARNMDIRENGVPDVKTEIIMFDSDTRGTVDQGVARYTYKRLDQNYPV